MPPRAVIFDFDGVIADTENVHVAAWESTFADMGWEVPPEVCGRAAEEDDGQFLAGLFASRGIKDGDVAGWVRHKQAATVAMLIACPRVYDGVREVVASLEGKAALAVVSGTWRENVTTVLEAAGLAGSFSVVVAKEDVARPKPDPEAYRLAIQRLGIEPAQAVAMEDSPTGLASALAAGVRAVAVGHRRAPGDWARGAAYLPGLLDGPAVWEVLAGQQ